MFSNKLSTPQIGAESNEKQNSYRHLCIQNTQNKRFEKTADKDLQRLNRGLKCTEVGEILKKNDSNSNSDFKEQQMQEIYFTYALVFSQQQQN